MTDEVKKETVAKRGGKSGRHLTPKKQAEMIGLWESGEFTLADLAEKFGLATNWVCQFLKKRGVVKGSAAVDHAKAVADEVAKASFQDATILAGRIRETKEEHYKMASGMAKLTWSEILTAKQDKVPFSTVLNNLKSLDTAMNVLKKSREERFAVLGLNKDDDGEENEIPQLIVEELTPDQVQRLQSRSFSAVDAELEDLTLEAFVDEDDADEEESD